MFLFRWISLVWCWKHLRLKDRGLGCGSCMVDRYRDNLIRSLRDKGVSLGEK